MIWKKRTPKVMPYDDDSIVEGVAKIRGIKDVNRFLSPTKDEMFDPYLIKNIEQAGMRIIEAIENNENVVVGSDCDSDGVTSTAIMVRQLREYIDNVDFIYGERSNGHGIHEQTRLDFINENDVNEDGEIINEEKRIRYELNRENLSKIENSDLLIIVDSSSNDTDACKMLTSKYGIDIIIIDHHNIERENPYALIVNPQQDGDEYPNKHLSGAGVVFKTVQVIEDLLGDASKVDPFKYLDLVAVGMYSDVMRMDVYENRFMVMYGLRNMKNTGLVRILKGAKADLFKLNGDSIGFSIAPMLNGVARLDNIKLAIDILLEDDDAKCKPIRLKMQKLNEQRKEIQKEMADRYEISVDINQKILLVMDENSSKGFNGLISQQLANKYKRPVLVGRLHGGSFSGSFRSYGGFNLKEFLDESGLVKEVAGHNQAGGVTVAEESIESLINYIENNMPSLDDIEPTVVYDLEIDVSEVEEYIKPMEQFNLVTGNGFPKVIIRVNNVTIEESNIIGKTKETCKISSFDNLEMIKFKVDESYGQELGYFDNIDVVGVLHMNEFYHWGLKKKISTPQVMLEDYKTN